MKQKFNQLPKKLLTIKNLGNNYSLTELSPDSLEKIQGGGNRCEVVWWGPGGFLDSVCR